MSKRLDQRMRIRIKTHGHQRYGECEGLVLAWVQTTERYNDQGGMVFQVPAVLLDVGTRVRLVPLQTERTWTEIEILGAEPKREHDDG